MDRDCLQSGAHVYRSIHGLCRWSAGCSPRSHDCRKWLHTTLPAASADPQLQPALCGIGACGADLRNVLSLNAHVRAAKYTGAISSFYLGTLRNVRGWCRQHRAFPLRLVPRSFVASLDVLEFRPADAGHALVHLLRNSRQSAGEEKRCRAQLRRIPLCERRICNVVCRARPGPEAGLVAVGAVQRTVFWRGDFLARCIHSFSAKPKSARRPATSAAMEYDSSWVWAGPFPFLPAGNEHPRAASTGGPWF